MAQTDNQVSAMWWPGAARFRPQKRATAGTIAAGVRIFQGAVAIAVDGVARPAVSGTAMQALCLKYTGGDANSHLYVSARQPGVRFALTSGAAESFAISRGSTIDITLTYNNTVSTPNSLILALLGHAEADRLLRFSTSGTGAGTALVAVLIANGALPFIEMLGVSPLDINNSAGVAAAALPTEALFTQGAYAMLPVANNAPTVGGVGYVYDDEQVTKVAFGTDLRGPVVGKTDDSVFYFLDLEQVS